MRGSRILQSLSRRHGVDIRVHHKIKDIYDSTTGLIRRLYLFDTVRGVELPDSTVRRVDGITDNAVSLKTVEMIFEIPALKVDTTTIIGIGSEQYVILACDDSDGVIWVRAQKLEDNEGVDMVIGPDVAYGESAGETIEVNHFVFQNGEELFLASQDDSDLPALGIVTDIIEDTIFHSRHASVSDLEISGSPGEDNKTIYLDVKGTCTFTEPTTGLKQVLGFAQTQNADDTWVATISIDSYIVPL